MARNDAGENANGEDDDRRSSERQGIGWRYLIHLVGESSGGRRRDSNSNCEPPQHRPHSASDDGAEYVPPAGTQRHSQTEFRRPLSDPESHHHENSDSCEYRRQAGCNPEQF